MLLLSNLNKLTFYVFIVVTFTSLDCRSAETRESMQSGADLKMNEQVKLKELTCAQVDLTI